MVTVPARKSTAAGPNHSLISAYERALACLRDNPESVSTTDLGLLRLIARVCGDRPPEFRARSPRRTRS